MDLKFGQRKLSIPERLSTRINKLDNGCWDYIGFKNDQGYGKMKALGESLAHRISYKLHIGSLTKDDCVLHRCDNTSCVNPEHLFKGDRDLNNKDRASKGRTVTPNMNLTHCKRGHEFTPENTVIRKKGTRNCRTCRNMMSRTRIERSKNL